MKTKNEQTEQNKNAAPMYLNRVTLVGFLADKADQYDGFAVLRLATKVSWMDKETKEWKSRTDWHRIIAWRPLADAVKSLGKGDYVLVEGELREGNYKHDLKVKADDGEAITVTMRVSEIRARAIRKLDRKKAQQPKSKKGGAA